MITVVALTIHFQNLKLYCITFKSVPNQTGDEQHIYLFVLQWARQVNLTTRKVIKGSAAKSDNYFYKLNNMMSWFVEITIRKKAFPFLNKYSKFPVSLTLAMRQSQCTACQHDQRKHLCTKPTHFYVSPNCLSVWFRFFKGIMESWPPLGREGGVLILN